MFFAVRDRKKSLPADVLVPATLASPVSPTPVLTTPLARLAIGAVEMAGRDYISGWLAPGAAPVFLEIQVGDAPLLTHAQFAPRCDIEATLGKPAFGFVYAFDEALVDGDRVTVKIHGGGELAGSPFVYRTPAVRPCETDVRVHLESPRGGLYRSLETFSGWAVLHDPFCDLRFTVNGVDQDVSYEIRPDVADHFRTPYSIGWTFTCDVAAASRTRAGAIDLVICANEAVVFRQRRTAHLASTNPDLLLFMHIPKTAGMSLVGAIKMQSRIDSHWLYGTIRHPISRQLSRLSPDALAGLDILGGHFTYGVHEQIPRRCAYISIVREPLAYLKSYFFYRKYVQRFSPFQDLDIYQALDARLDHLLDNGLTRFFAPKGSEPVDSADLLRAKTNLENGFAFVGLVERLEESVARISAMLRCDLAVLNDNRTPATDEAASIDPDEFARRAEPYVAYDRILYHHAKRLFWDTQPSVSCLPASC